MRYILFSLFISSSSFVFSQKQRMGNVFLANNMNPAIQVAQSNNVNYRLNNDNNNGNQISQLNNSDENANDVQQQSVNNIGQAADNDGMDFNFSLDLSSRSSSSSASASGSRSHKHVFTRKLKRFERNFYGKLGSHKKNKHLVDVCFNWR